MMNGSVGQALREARLAKKITIEEAARATKIRPERIADLEADDYMRFPNIVYARSFLILYAKYLGVDISRFPTLEIGFDTGVGEYAYLQQSGEEDRATPARRRHRRATSAQPEKPQWLIAFFIFLVMLAAGALIGWGIITIKRLGPVESRDIPIPTPTPAATATPGTPATPAPTLTPAPTPLAPGLEPPVSRARSEQVIRAVPVVTPGSPAVSATPEATPEPTPQVIVAVPVNPATATASPSSTEAPTPVTEGEEQEITIRSNRKIRLRVERDNPKAPSLYHGSLNPLMKPLVFVGRHFWIKTAEPDALEVTINGQPAPTSTVEIIPTPGI